MVSSVLVSSVWRGLRSVPAVVVIAVDVEDLLALDGEHAAWVSVREMHTGDTGETYPESTHSVKPAGRVSVNADGGVKRLAEGHTCA
jgi:hypothetical protein